MSQGSLNPPEETLTSNFEQHQVFTTADFLSDADLGSGLALAMPPVQSSALTHHHAAASREHTHVVQ
jgi:hypothetical protein